MNSSPKTNQEIIFPAEVSSFIQASIEKYKLKEVEEKEMKRMREAKTFREKKEIFEGLPGRKIARAIKEVAGGKILVKDFPSHLQQLLNITSTDAKKLAEELEEKVLIKEIREVPPKIPLGGVVKPPPIGAEVTEEEPAEIKPEIKPEVSSKKPISKESDIYRETIE